MDFHKIWIEQCEAARGIEDEFGTDKALKYLVEEKFINFLEAAETNAEFRAEIPAFVAEIKMIFEPWQLRECLEKALAMCFSALFCRVVLSCDLFMRKISYIVQWTFSLGKAQSCPTLPRPMTQAEENSKNSRVSGGRLQSR